MAPQWFLPGKKAPVSDDTNEIPPIPVRLMMMTSSTAVLTSTKQGTLGLKPLHQPETVPDVDIVAVHGLGGDSMSTWTCDGHIWLKDFLPQALESPPPDYAYGPKDSKAVRVMTFGYDANVFTKAASQRSFTFAEDLLSQLKDRRGGEAVC